MGTAIVITSGKGGTGKSSLTAGLGSCLAAMGKRVLCVDMDIGLRNLDLTLGMSDVALMDVSDVLEGRCPLSHAAAVHPKLEHLALLPAPVTPPRTPLRPEGMAALVAEAKERYDFCLIDSPAGLGSGFQLSICAADRAVVVSTTDPASLRAAQSAVGCLRRREIPIHLVVNRVTRAFLRKTHTNIDDAMDALGLPLLGIIPEDARIPLAASRGIPVIMTSRRGGARAYYNISRRILGERVPPMRI